MGIGQFLRDKEIMTQWYYYERMALLLLSDNQDKAKIQHVNPEDQRSEKHCFV